MSESANPLVQEDKYENTGYNTVWWFFTHIDGRVVSISNPRIEADGDESGTWYWPVYDEMQVNGVKATDDEHDELHDHIMEHLKATDWKP